ncbi:hypothetical protein EDD16DRAFT_116687 [Pisolithus croceorrhizus]|nr:hypothetical protein EDD16DRAFT_116687 [Pisolithus croceorrhizus]
MTYGRRRPYLLALTRKNDCVLLFSFASVLLVLAVSRTHPSYSASRQMRRSHARMVMKLCESAPPLEDAGEPGKKDREEVSMNRARQPYC